MEGRNSMAYSGAITEIDRIVEDLENSRVSINDLPGTVKAAAERVRFCQEKLRATVTEVKTLIGDLEGEESGQAPNAGRQEEAF